ncbi:uncharacterized hydrophobic domain-containing protein [Aquimarina amphilecti]|uniref:Uncharacterized hydrophobic domain-containing protein n=1 Tax=Aquimarina amphilecti TaxID=1038014 RepID=A0A1H7UWT2_AQUAM|nr:DUF389 domain-containing protein [Aquimarina amphilecti]SEM01430.1 uncharacterized hydrophobic domain-containing protein [Aquimarina amphilecti]
MEENTQNPLGKSQDEKVEEQKKAVKKDAKGLFRSGSTFLKELLDFRHDTDRESTIELIKADIPFKGATAWILICSIFIASIGLNANSIPVVIGAMLISPLMGPILGIGMSIAVNDIDTLRKSLVNFTVMVVLSILTAWLFFFLFPLKVESSELLARTKPDIRDVLIAFFGGLALIIARTKKGTIASVIFGVAIATALMPPLCTVGFGLAVGKYEYALGAMFLFTINTIFIALATFIVLKLLRFPMLRYANSAKRKLIARLVSFTAVLVMIPAIYTFVITLNQSKMEGDYDRFIAEEIDENPDLYLRKPIPDYDKKTIKLFFDGEITEATKSDLENEILKYENISDFNLIIRGNKARGIDQISKANDRYIVELNRLETENEALLDKVEDLKIRLALIETQLAEAQKVIPIDILPYNNIAKDAKIRFPDLSLLGYGEVLQSNFLKVDTVKVIFPQWKFQVSDSLNDVRNKDLREWITGELKADTLLVQ